MSLSLRLAEAARRLARPRVTMRRMLLLLLAAGGFALVLIACSQRSGGQTDSGPASTPNPGHGRGLAGHESSEGLTLHGTNAETVYAGARCAPTAPLRSYRIAAVNVEMTLNRYLDHDPQGRMYVLEEELERVRKEEAQNQAARLTDTEPGVTIGLQGDAIQPLALRVNKGDCLRLTLRNALANAEPASLHLHGSSLHLASGGAPAIATNPGATVRPGESVTYQWMVGQDEPEGTHYFHSHGDTREQTNHGLFGAVIVEPAGSSFIDPLTGDELRSGWSAIIRDPSGSSFREFALFYHEVGDEQYLLRNRAGQTVPQVDAITSAYRPGARAMNYRSEPFMNRLELQKTITGQPDKSGAYSSYVFGDPATPVARSYLGDPVKERVVHGGSEVFHVHHVHGGAIRWRRQANVEPSDFAKGLDKHPPLLPQATERVDSQAVGPSETFDLAHECGSGGCQQSAGDFLVHCHVAHHYLAGMWMIWRVYDTLQDSAVPLDALPPLRELPDRTGGMKPAVTSTDLIGRTVDWKGRQFGITRQNLPDWVERQLPPPGLPRGYDASVLDWKKEGSLYLNELETGQAWPGYRSPSPGRRPPIMFNPLTGKLAYPFLRPHLGKRPPFAPDHGPAPFLDPAGQGSDVPQPGANGPRSVCPAGTRTREYTIHAISLPIPLNRRLDIIDPTGEIFVLKEEEEEVRANNGLKRPLAIRANAGEDCVDILFKNELPDAPETGFFSKADIHIHFVQFDVQASDGVNTGFNYEQSVRPFAVEGEAIESDVPSGARAVHVASPGRFQTGVLIGVGMDQDKTFEIRRIAAIEGDVLTFDEPLRFGHARGEIVSAEFVRYRWYPDAQFGTAYFHDHVDALGSWKHGLFGALIVEPPGSTYHDPRTGAQVRSGPIADIRTSARVSADLTGSFREMAMFIQDDNPPTSVGRSAGGTFNLRAEPLRDRGDDPSRLFSATAHGDPETPVLEAYAGDPLVVRGLVSGTNDVHTWHLDGHWFRVEPHSLTSPPVNTIPIGISERYDMVVPRAGGPQGRPGDYLYYNARSFKLREGAWGILRVHDASSTRPLQPLPGREAVPRTPPPVCPADAPQKRYAIAAIETGLPMLEGTPQRGKVYVLEADRAATASGRRPPEPLALHVNVGDCVMVSLKNETPGPVSFHADMLAYDPREDQPTAPGQSRSYTYFASPEVGETAALVRDWGDVLRNPGLGLYGAIIVGPRGSRYTNPVTGEDTGLKASWSVNVHPPSGASYRDFSLFLQDEDEIIGTAQMPYTRAVTGVAGLNYRKEPFDRRLTKDADTSRLFARAVHGDPSTPILQAFAGDAMRVHVLSPFSEQAHVFSIEGHRWPMEPGKPGTTLLSSVHLGALQALTLRVAGAGGEARLPGDYLYGDHREPFREAGLWGLFRVYPPGAKGITLRPLPGPA